MTFDIVKCLGSPRTSQMPRSGSFQCSIAALDELLDQRPAALREMVARLGVQEDRVEHHAPHVVLLLVVGAVADAHRLGAVVAVEVVEGLLLELALALDAVHHLDVVALLGDVLHEVEVVVGLPVEAERVQAPEHERGVAHPRVAVVPVALAAGRLGQRRRRRRDHRAGRRVGQPLQRQRAALQVRAPRVVGERAVRQPLVPEVRRCAPAARRPRRSSSAPGAWRTPARRTPCRRRAASCARGRASPRSRAAGRSSGSAASASPRRTRPPRCSRRPRTPTRRTCARSRRSGRTRAPPRPSR